MVRPGLIVVVWLSFVVSLFATVAPGATANLLQSLDVDLDVRTVVVDESTNLGVDAAAPPAATAPRASVLEGVATPPKKKLATRAEAAAKARRAQAAAPLTIKLMTYNVLGSDHTTARGAKPGFGPGVQRARWTAEVLRQYAPSVVGMQELDFDQLGVLRGELANYTFFPGDAATGQTVKTTLAWQTSRFELMDSGFNTVRFLDQTRSHPYVLLKDLETGRQFWVFNIHNSPNRHSAGTYAEQRRAQVASQVAVVKNLSKTAPVFMTGDFNDKEFAYCQLTSQTNLRASQGGGASPCQPPRLRSVDWIFGTSAASWSGVSRDRGPLVARSTDHHIFVATATLK